MSSGPRHSATSAVLGLFLLGLLFVLAKSAQPIYFRSVLQAPGTVIDTVTDTQNGYFYVLFNDSLVKYSSTSLAPVQTIDNSHTPYVLDQDIDVILGRLRILNDGVDNWLLLCGGTAVGIANLTEPTLSLTTIWTTPTSTEFLASCSVAVPTLLWVGTSSKGATASFYALQQPTNWKTEWEAQSNTLSFAEPLIRDFDVMSDGSGYATVKSLTKSGIYQFDLVPTPSSVSTAAFLPVGSVFPITAISDELSDSFYIQNLISMTQLTAGTSDVSLIAVFEGVGAPLSVAMDTRVGKRVLWGTYCNNGTFMTQRFSMDTDSVQLTPTHSSAMDNPPIACVVTEASSVAFARGSVDAMRNLVITNPSPNTLVFTAMHNCSASTTCSECQSDNMYCSWCVSPSGSSCVESSTCSAANAFGLTSCPVLTLATPAAASAEGSTSVVLTGANFISVANQTASQGGPYCKLGSSVSSATVLSDSLLRCNINPTSVNGTLRMGLSLSTGILLDSTTLAYSIYTCSSSETCASCATRDQPDCAWCASDQVCSSRLNPRGICPTVNSLLVTYGSSAVRCGTLTSITPNSIPVHFAGTVGVPQTVSISAAYPNATTGWQCSFGFSGGVMEAGTLDYAAQTLSCPIAPLDSMAVGLQERVIPVSVYFKGKLFATNTLDLTYYNCSRPSTCGDCTLATRPFCSWCLSSVQCIPSSQSGTCTDVASSTCPSATLTPLSTDGSAIVPLTITGGPFVSSASFSCQFESSSGSLTTTTNPATRNSATSLTCNAPASAVSDPFDATVSILLNGAVYTVAGNLRYYTCSPATVNCSNCADPLHTTCSWCTEETRCGLTSSMSSCPSAISGACPTITGVAPTYGAIAGALPVVLSGANLATNGSYECAFANPSTSTLYIAATAHNTSSVNCNTPTATLAGNYSASVRYTDPTSSAKSTLVSVATFHYIDCTAQTSCGKCLATSQCIWCTWAGSCKTASTACDVTTGIRRTNVTDLAKCPTITSVSPMAFQVGTVTAITVTGKGLATAATDGNLVCQLDAVNFVQAQRISTLGAATDVLLCNTRPSQQPGTNPFKIRWTQTSAEYATYLDTSGNAIQITGFDCSAATTCDQCAASSVSFCGWCSVDGACTTRGTCSNNATWAQSNCPRVTAMSRHEIDQSTIGATLDLTVSALNLAASASLQCQFSTPIASATAPATYSTSSGSSSSSSTYTVSCPTTAIPGTDLTAFANVQLVYADSGKPFTFNIGDAFYDPNSNLEYVNCISPNRTMDTCPTCLDPSPPVGGLVDSRCGWCVYSGRCALASSCLVGSPIDPYQNATSECAHITDIEPREGPSTGSTLITISGTGFVNDARLQCMFGSLLSPTAFSSATSVGCISPARSDISSGSAAAEISLVLFDAPSSSRKRATGAYTVFATSASGISFTYNFVSASKKSNLSWIAAPVIVVILLIAILILVLILLRRRNKARKLTPPDFNKYAFSANTRLMREVPTEMREKLDQLVPLLSENSYLLALSIRNVTHGSDDDLLSRALIYASYPNSFALDMLVHFIQTEVTESEVEGELFRASSIACKMYTVYSKVVGVQYLWRTLARSIHTLDDAGQAEDKRHQTGSDHHTTPPSTGQVSMMDLGTLEVDPERLAERLEKDVDQSVMTDVTIYQYELLLKTGRIFKKVMDSVNSVPRELRIVAKRVKTFVGPKFREREMDYKGVCAFFFLRFICPAVMTPQIYGVLEQAPGETSQRYFVLISKTLQNLANGTLPSQKEAYMAKMDEFVLENKDTLHRFIDTLCNVQEHAADVQLDDEHEHNARDIRLNVQDDLYYSSLSFLHSHYMAHSIEIQDGFRQTHDEEFGDRVDAVMRSIGGGDEPEEKHSKKKSSKKAKKHAATSSNAS